MEDEPPCASLSLIAILSETLEKDALRANITETHRINDKLGRFFAVLKNMKCEK